MHCTRLRAAALCVLLAGTGDGLAATFCVTTSNDLAAALQAAATNGQHDQVRIAVGTYLTPGAAFEYDDNVSGADGMDVDISGGWTEFFGNPCGQQLPGNHQDTILDGQNANRVFRAVLTTGPGALSLRYLRIQNGLVGSGFNGGGMSVFMGSGFTGRLVVEGVHFAFNDAGFAGALDVNASGNHSGVTVANNVFMYNSADCRFGAAKLAQAEGASTFFVNNTVAYNFHGDTCNTGQPGNGGADFYAFGADAHLSIVNNLFWANETEDVAVRGSPDAEPTYQHNNHGVAFLERVGISGGNLSVDPQLKFTGGGSLQFPTYRLSEGSPMVDAGSPPPAFWYLLLGPHDVDGQPRVTGRSVDIGAFEEQTPLFGDGFDGDPPQF